MNDYQVRIEIHLILFFDLRVDRDHALFTRLRLFARSREEEDILTFMMMKEM